MLKFFRTIRKKLIEEDNVRKYLLYAIGEILLVVIGILIALQVNNWNEERKKTNRENQLLAQLTEDVDLLLEELDIDIGFLKRNVSLTDTLLFYRILNPHQNWEYYFKAAPWGNPKVYPPIATYENLKSIGLEVISDPDLRNRITDLYDRKLKRSTEWENMVYTYQFSIEKLMEQSFDFKQDSEIFFDSDERMSPVFIPSNYQEFLSHRELYNTTITFQQRRRLLVSRYEDTRLLASDIMNSLNSLQLQDK